jgi:hypothetical protein
MTTVAVPVVNHLRESGFRPSPACDYTRSGRTPLASLAILRLDQKSMWKLCWLTAALAAALWADGPGVITARFQNRDLALTADPAAPHWKQAAAVVADNGPQREAVPGHRTEIRALWTKQNLYLLFSCPYEKLYLKPSPSTSTETNRLWEWDVAEVFVGADFQNIRRYREFQVSPQGEWVDLDIDKDHPLPEGGWKWNSRFAVKARLDRAKKIWYGEMRIPIQSIDTRPAKKGNEMRINLYRIQGPPPGRTFIAWQPTGSPSYHEPEAFGRLRLE